MIGLLRFALAVLASPFKSKLRLEAENAVLRHQLIVLKRRLRGRVRFTNNDRWFLIQLYRWFPSILKVQARRLNTAGFSFAVVGRGELLVLLPFKAMLLSERRGAENLAAQRCSHLLSRSRGILLITGTPG
jgi:hypothetical protein